MPKSMNRTERLALNYRLLPCGWRICAACGELLPLTEYRKIHRNLDYCCRRCHRILNRVSHHERKSTPPIEGIHDAP